MEPGNFWKEGTPDELDAGMWRWGRWERKGKVKDEAKISAQANIRMEFPLMGMEKTVGGAVLGRRWEFGVGFAQLEMCPFRYNVGGVCPEAVGGQRPGACQASARTPAPYGWLPSHSRGQFLAQLNFKNFQINYLCLQHHQCLLPEGHWKLLGSSGSEPYFKVTSPCS